MNSDSTYRVWVGCLACYNAGRLVGDWFDADECPLTESEFDEAIPNHLKAKAGDLYPHEEIWVMDHENSPVDGEYSPNAAHEYAEWMAGIDDLDVLKAWLSNGNEFNADTADEIQEAYAGHFDSDEAFAQELADEVGAIQEDVQWPYTCIDWEHAARELMYDYWSDNGYYFRNQ